MMTSCYPTDIVKGLIALLTVHLALSGRTRMSKHCLSLTKQARSKET